MRMTGIQNKRILVASILILSGITACDKEQKQTVPSKDRNTVQQTASRTENGSATYRLVSQQAEVKVTTVKNHNTPVTGVFHQPAGLLQLQDGVLSGFVGVSTEHYDTGLSARDANIQEVFFQNAVSMAAAKASVRVEGWRIPDAVGSDSVAVEIPVFVDLLGASATVTMPARMQVLPEGINLQVRDFAISFDDLQLRSRLILLMERCNHKAVSEDFAIDFSGHFKRAVPAASTPPE